MPCRSSSNPWKPGVWGQGPYTGVILLDAEKKVLVAYSRLPKDELASQPGSTYTNLPFQGPGDSLHKIVVLYRTSPLHPSGRRSIELPLEMKDQRRTLGWLRLPLDLGFLLETSRLDEQGLTSLRFARR
ncbi:hypothetical protein DFAR_800017 [Desulfarculales bacterium]